MKKWIKILLVILLFAIISLAIYFILNHFGLTNITHIRKLIENSKEYGLLVFFIICTLSPILFCFIPLLSGGLCILGIVLFDPITTFIVCILSGIISASILFLIGDKIGEGLAKKIVGEEALNHAQDLINSKSKILLPILFILPILPHEAITIVAGMTKLKYWYILLVNILHLLVETSLICFFGSSLINWSSLSVLDWIVFINVVVIDVILLLKLEKKVK